MNLYYALCYANTKGWVINAEVIINFGCLGITHDEEVLRAFHLWRDRLRDWLYQRGILPVYIYIRERPADISLHIHMLMHIPRAHHAAFVKWAQEFCSLSRQARCRG